MKTALVIAALLCTSPAFAQTPAPAAAPTVGGKPLLQVKPRATAAKPASIAEGLRACLEIDDGTKGRLDCYDAVIAPRPNTKTKTKPKTATGVADCRFYTEQDERLACFNGFAETIPKFSSR